MTKLIEVHISEQKTKLESWRPVEMVIAGRQKISLSVGEALVLANDLRTVAGLINDLSSTQEAK